MFASDDRELIYFLKDEVEGCESRGNSKERCRAHSDRPRYLLETT